MPLLSRDAGALTGPVDVESLTVAMAVAPGVYSRNRFFDLFQAPDVRRARRRASVIQSIVTHLQLLREAGADLASVVAIEREVERVVIRYRVPRLAMRRRVGLTPLEASCVLFLAQKAALPGLAPTDDELSRLGVALSRLPGEAAALPV